MIKPDLERGDPELSGDIDMLGLGLGVDWGQANLSKSWKHFNSFVTHCITQGVK